MNEKNYMVTEIQGWCPACGGSGMVMEYGPTDCPHLDAHRLLARIETLSESPCETFTRGTCADDPGRSLDAPYLADQYCWPCRVRAALQS